MPPGKKIDFTDATDRARHIRELFKQLEERLHGAAWTPQEVMLGYVYDIGELGRLVMATEGRWAHKGDLPRELEDKLSECLWWVLVLADRLGVDITTAFTAKMNDLDVELTKSVAKGNQAAQPSLSFRSLGDSPKPQATNHAGLAPRKQNAYVHQI
jgi:NTP pyrophosphatase (non-canonical NTP hydrolase)